MSSERMIKIPIIARPLIFLTQQYMICVLKSYQEGEMAYDQTIRNEQTRAVGSREKF